MLLANIIFPAPSAAYVSTFFIPLATILALGTEFIVFSRTQRGIASNGKLLFVVLALNVFSWVVGLFISFIFPSGLVPLLTPSGVSIITQGPRWGIIAILSFPFACLVSAALECLGLRFFFRRIPFPAPIRTVAIANLASYVVLGATVFVFLHFDWF